MQLSWPQTLKEVLHQGNHACNVLEQKKGQILEAKISDFLYQSSFYTVMTFPSWRYSDSGSVLFQNRKFLKGEHCEHGRLSAMRMCSWSEAETVHKMDNSTPTNASLSNEDDTGLKIPLGYHIVAYLAIVLGFSANPFICFSFAYFRRVRSVNNYFVVNLAVIDILFIILLCIQIAAPALQKRMSTDNFYYLKETLLITEQFCYSGCMAAVTIISYDRYYSVTKPLHYYTNITHTKAIIFIACNWSYATVMALLQLLFYLPNENYFKYGYLSLMGLTNAVIPLYVILYCYMNIFIIASRHLRHNPHRGQDQNGEASVFTKNLKIAFHILVLVAPVLLFWSTFSAVTIIEVHCPDCIPKHSFLDTIMSMTPNVIASVDPIIYIFLTKDFREIICGWFKLHRSHPFSFSETFHLSTTKSTNPQVLPAAKRLVSESGDSLEGSYRLY